MYRLIREGKIKEFNSLKSSGQTCDLIGADFRGVSLCGLDADDLDLSNCYFRMSNLRGIDLSKAKLDGASIHGAQISGVRFPDEIAPEEIKLSLEHGTRLRYR